MDEATHDEGTRGEAARGEASRGAWIAQTPGLERLDARARDLLATHARLVQVPRGGRAFAVGADCTAYLIVVRGCIRVQLLAETGREIVLYRVRAGESCVLTTSCLMTRAPYGAEAVAEAPVLAAALPAETFRTLLADAAPFRDFVLTSYAERVADLMVTMEEVVFHRIDRRLARLLAGRETPTIAATHQEIAVELGSAREVVSRQLKAFEKMGLVALARGQIEIRDRAGLLRLAEEAA